MNIGMNEQNEQHRIVIHFDLDAFYVACERELNPCLRGGRPVAVSQYNPRGKLEERSAHDVRRRLVRKPPPPAAASLPSSHNTSSTTLPLSSSSTTLPLNRSHDDDNNQTHHDHVSSNNHNDDDACNGSLIAVSYEARAAGVRRNDRGREAIRKCPQLHIVVVPTKHGKSDITMYRNASKRVLNVLTNAICYEQRKDGWSILQQQPQQPPTASATAITHYADAVEVASIDEVYVEVTNLVQVMMNDMMMDEHDQDDDYDNDHDQDDALWKEMMKGARNCTTIGGLETLSPAAKAVNALNKEDLRKGSCLQVLDAQQQQQNQHHQAGSGGTDEGSLAWWNRPKRQWTHVEVKLACGALLAWNARRAVSRHFDGGVFTLSAGISTNKTLAKLASGLKKPNRQTIVNPCNVGDGGGNDGVNVQRQSPLQTLYHPLPLSRIRGLGGKLGRHVQETLGVKTVGQLSQVSLVTLQLHLSDDKLAHFLYDIGRGICRDAVKSRTSKPQSIASSKNFRGNMLAISSTDVSKLSRWVGELCNELTERLESDRREYNRYASTLVVAMVVTSEARSSGRSSSRQCRAPNKLELYREVAMRLIQQLVEVAKSRLSVTKVTITFISISATHFVDQVAGPASILAAFERAGRRSQRECATSKSVSSPTLPRPHQSSIQSCLRAKSSVMDSWLSSSGGAKKNTVPRKRSSGVAANVATKRRRTMPAADSHADDPSSLTRLPTMDEIDPDVLKELPQELRESLINDIRRVHPTREAKGIAKFFRTNDV